jgi:hypothetical protein
MPWIDVSHTVQRNNRLRSTKSTTPPPWKGFDERRSENGNDSAEPFDPPIKRHNPAGCV